MVARLWTVIVLVVSTASAASAADDPVNRGLASRMTREAVAAGAEGDNVLREDLLVSAVRVAPDFAPAHWARGEMKVDGQWKSIVTIQDEASQNRQIQKYRELRQSADASPAAELELAIWCQHNGLQEEARYHWLQVLAVDRNNSQALRALDSQWVGNQLLPRDQAEQIEAERRNFRKANADWRTRIAGWQRSLAAGGDEAARALAEVEAVVDESAITEFENLASEVSNASSTKRARDRQLCEKYLSALERLPSLEASASLVRIAVLSNDELLRNAAIEKLKTRPEYEVLPQLIAGLAPIIESRVEMKRSETGRISYTHEFFAEGPDADYVAENTVSATVQSRLPVNAKFDQVAAEANRINRGSYNQWQRLARDAARLEYQAARINASRDQVNGRITTVLQELTGQSFGNNPNQWWDYWRDENGYDDYRDTIEYKTYLTYTQPPCECFAAGTLVWTKTGTQAIETLTAGDLVLTMDERNGERCFRPVLERTLRDPSPLVRIATEGYQLLATPGHPFWVEGTGWRMAKELEPGDRVLSAHGSPIEIRVVSSSDVEEEAFNLVVEGNNNYFVGQDGLLSHDNTQRRPELARAAAQ